MPDTDFDFAIFGSSPTAALLAILLATQHGKKVCLVANPPVKLQLTRNLDISIAPFTRPHSWSLLQSCKGELEKFLGKRDAALLSKTRCAIVANSAGSVDALNHIRHMAAAFEFITAPVPTEKLNGHKIGFTFDGVTRLRHRIFYDLLGAWLSELSIPTLSPSKTNVSLKRNGVVLNNGPQKMMAEMAIVTDGDFIQQLVPPTTLDQVCFSTSSCALITEPGAKSHNRVLLDLDAGAYSYVHPDLRVECRIRGDKILATKWLATHLMENSSVRLAGATQISTVESRDGAPLVGPIGAPRLQLCVGFDPVGAFLAPALARHFAGSGTPSEKTYFNLHAPNAKRHSVGEINTHAIETSNV